MTFAALQTIHSILENEKYKATKHFELCRNNYIGVFDEKLDEFGSNARADRAMVGLAVTADYDNARHDLHRIQDALEEFESHDWR